MINFSISRFIAFFRKESKQVIRDPSSLLIAIILPILMMFLFGYGVSLDTNVIKIGVSLEDDGYEAVSLANSFAASKFFAVEFAVNRKKLQDKMVSGDLRGVIVIPENFSRKINNKIQSQIQVIADGSETNTAIFVKNYADGVVNNWLNNRKFETGIEVNLPISVDSRIWFNEEIKSRNFILPGAISIIMAMIGVILTSMVIAKEWERGTMEAIMSTPILIYEMIIAKLLPYFILGLFSMTLCLIIAVLIYDVPFRGSLIILYITTSIFLLASLGQGILISSATKNQFMASQIATLTAFLPAFMLSGFLFEINSMPLILRIISHIVPSRYFVPILQSNFLSDTVWVLIIPNVIAIMIIAIILFVFTLRSNVKRIA
jgi:ABC-2 type transport system permease protein